MLDFTDKLEIRTAILQGDIDKAIKLTTTHYPRALDENPEIVFRLKCRKFVEMIRRCSELLFPPSPDPNNQLFPSRPTNGHASVFDEEMDLDEDEDDEEDEDEDEDEEAEEEEAGDDDDDEEEEADDPDDPDNASQTSSHPSATPEHNLSTAWPNSTPTNPPTQPLTSQPLSQSQPHSHSQPFHSAPTSTSTTHPHTLTHSPPSPSPATTATYDALLQEAMAYGQTLMREYRDEPPSWRRALEDIFSLIAYSDARGSVNGHLLERGGRVGVAEDVNGAILGSFCLLLLLCLAVPIPPFPRRPTLAHHADHDSLSRPLLRPGARARVSADGGHGERSR